jgi:hypothetical protein
MGAGEANDDGGALSRSEYITRANTATAMKTAAAANPVNRPADHLRPPGPPSNEAPQA